MRLSPLEIANESKGLETLSRVDAMRAVNFICAGHFMTELDIVNSLGQM